MKVVFITHLLDFIVLFFVLHKLYRDKLLPKKGKLNMLIRESSN